MAGKLSVARIKTLTKPGRYGDGDGLWLQVRNSDARSWLFRYTRDGRARAMGLGEYPVIGLAEARDAALAARRHLANGIDPLAAREAGRAAKRQEAVAGISFRAVAELYIKAHSPTWRNEKHRAQWGSTLTAYAYPHFGDKPVAAIGTGDVMAALDRLWHEKPETAARLRGRIETVLDYAGTREWRRGENPARWRGHLQNLLPARAKVRAVEHHAALPWAETAAFVAALRGREGVAARALEFAVLTAARSGEVRGATWGEIDLQAAVWSIPSGRMKAGKEHRVPLSDAALTLLRGMRNGSPDPASLVFPGAAGTKPLSDMSLTSVLRRMERADLTAHGFRSTFRDWASERTAYEPHVVEKALAHAIGSKVEAAYRRGDLFDKRRRLMADWAAFCEGNDVSAATVVPIRRAG